MKLKPFMCTAAALTLLFAAPTFYAQTARAQVFDFGQIDAFESMGTGTQHGGSPPKTIVDDSERHTIFFTILESNTEAKIYWKSDNGDQTTLIHGPSVKAFQTVGQFKIEALGDENHSFKYGYMLFRLKGNNRLEIQTRRKLGYFGNEHSIRKCSFLASYYEQFF